MRSAKRLPVVRAYRFFFVHAGHIVGERARCALSLARAEIEAEAKGIEFVWEPEQDIDASWMSAEDRKQDHEVEWARAVLPCPEHGVDCLHARTLASLGNIFDADNNYRRVINAELAQEAIDNL